MDNSSFTPLHVHTSYSAFDCLSKVDELVLQSRKMGFKSLAITDHGGIAGWIKFIKECRKKKDKNDNDLLGADGNILPTIKPILGMEAYLAKSHKARGKIEQSDGRKGNRHIVLLAKNQEGYSNICNLSQIGHIDGQAFGDPRIDFELLAKYSGGIIAGSACLSSVVNNNLLYGRYNEAKKAATLLKDIFHEDFYLEVMYHGIDAEGAIIPDIIKLGKQLGVLVCSTNDSHYLYKNQASSHELLMAISTSRCIKDPKAYHFPYGEFYLKSAAEMAQIFGSVPELIYNTNAIAERVEDFFKPSGMRLPKFDIQLACKEHNIGIDNADKLTPLEFMEIVAMQGMVKCGWDNSQPHLDRLKQELFDVGVALKNNNMDFATYFLIVWDYIAFAKKNKIRTGGGRGSGSASLLLRVLGITSGVDPIKYPALLWQRFLAFDTSFFFLDEDWGFENVEKEIIVPFEKIEEETEDEMVIDEGGIDRY